MNTANNLWNSLEIVKILIAIISPLVIAFIGYKINSILLKIEKTQWINKTVVEWKIKIYEDITPDANDIYCFFMYIGDWKRISPLEIVEKKRRLDKVINLSSPIFSDRVKESYDNFIDSCFEEFRGKGLDLGLKTGFDSRKTYADSWNIEWEGLFVDNKTPREKIKQSYELFVRNLSKDLDLSLNLNN
jgi:hypothetical protein